VTHGGKRAGSGRKPGKGLFTGGRPTTTKKVKVGQTPGVWVTDANGSPVGLGESWVVKEIDRTRIVWESLDTGDIITMLFT